MIPFTVDQSVADIVIPHDANPAGHGEPLTRELQEAIWEASDSDRVKAIILRRERIDGRPPGVSPEWTPTAMGVFGRAIEDLYGATGVYQTLAVCKKVTFWEAEGVPAFGDSLFALFADFAIADPDALFHIPLAHLPETNFAMAVLKMRLQATKAWLLSGKPMSAAQAHQFGLVNRISAPGDVHAATLRLARRVAVMPLDAIVASKLAHQVLLDTQGVASEFDSAPFFAATQALATGAVTGKVAANGR